MFLTHCKLGVKRHFQVFPVCVDIHNSSVTVRHQYPVITAQEELLLSTCRLNEVPFLIFFIRFLCLSGSLSVARGTVAAWPLV